LGEEGKENGDLIQISKRGSSSAHLRSQQGSTNEYAYDYSFGPEQTQQQVYEKTTLPLIEKVLEGQKATVFAYGSTGAGKTHTMMGSMRTDEDLLDDSADGSGKGLIPRALVDTFAAIESQKQLLANAGKKWVISCSYLEVYNERIYDLISPSTKPLDIREDATGGVHVAGLTDTPSVSASEVLELLLIGNRNRKTESTAANQVSSRSHAVLQLQVSCTEIDSKGATITTKGKLSLIDLAGSERASATKNSGVRLVEGAKINKSLLALANCINALAAAGAKGSGASHRAATKTPARTPARSRLQRLRPGSARKSREASGMKVNFRDSKLTHLLKPSLTGEAHVVMVANVNPSHLFYEDSHNTLKYANRAKNIKIAPGASGVTRSENSAVDRALLLQQENERLRTELSKLQTSTPGPALNLSSMLGKRSRGTDTDKREPKRRLSDQTRQLENVQLKERVNELETGKKKLEDMIDNLEAQLSRASFDSPLPPVPPVPPVRPPFAGTDELTATSETDLTQVTQINSTGENNSAHQQPFVSHNPKAAAMASEELTERSAQRSVTEQVVEAAEQKAAKQVALPEECSSEKKEGRYFLRRLRTPGKQPKSLAERTTDQVLPSSTKNRRKSLADRPNTQKKAGATKNRKKRQSLIPRPTASALNATPTRTRHTIECDPSSRRRSNRSRKSLIPRPRGTATKSGPLIDMDQQENCDPNSEGIENPFETW
jgi:kinesin family protein 18/19